MLIALDAMGGDRAPHEAVAGAVQAARQLDCRHRPRGTTDLLEAELARHEPLPSGLQIVRGQRKR